MILFEFNFSGLLQQLLSLSVTLPVTHTALYFSGNLT